jgi:hypothetical protein
MKSKSYSLVLQQCPSAHSLPRWQLWSHEAYLGAQVGDIPSQAGVSFACVFDPTSSQVEHMIVMLCDDFFQASDVTPV